MDSQFYYTLATIFSSLMAISFAIILPVLGSISQKYNSSRIIKRFFRLTSNYFVYGFLSLGIILSLLGGSGSVNLPDQIYWILLIGSLIQLFFMFIETATYGDPLILVKPFLRQIKNTKRKKEALEEIRDIIENTRRFEAEQIIDRLQEISDKSKILTDKDLINSYIKEIGKDFSKKSSSVSIYSVAKLLSLGKESISFAKRNKGFWLVENTISYSMAVYIEMRKYGNRDFQIMDVEVLFNKFELFAIDLIKGKIVDELENLLDLFEQVYALINELSIEERGKEYIKKRYNEKIYRIKMERKKANI